VNYNFDDTLEKLLMFNRNDEEKGNYTRLRNYLQTELTV